MTDLPLSDMSNLTATAILGWYTWHTVSKTLPAIVTAFRDEMCLVRAECRAEREAVYNAMASERQQFHADQVAMVEALNRLSQQLQPLSKGRGD